MTSATLRCFDLTDSGEKSTLVDTEEYAGETRYELDEYLFVMGVNGLETLELELDGVSGEDATRILLARPLRCGVTGANGRRSETEDERVVFGDAVTAADSCGAHDIVMEEIVVVE